MNKFILTLLLIPSLVFGQSCPQNVSKAKYGTVVTCDSFIVAEPLMQEFRKQDAKIDNANDKILTLEKLRVLDSTEIEFYKKRSERLNEQLDKSERSKFWSNLGHFALGVVITGIAAKAAIESTK